MLATAGDADVASGSLFKLTSPQHRHQLHGRTMLLYQITHHPHMRRGVRIKRLIARTKHVVWFIFPSVRAHKDASRTPGSHGAVATFRCHTIFVRWCQKVQSKYDWISAHSNTRTGQLKISPQLCCHRSGRQIAPVIKFKMGNKLY